MASVVASVGARAAARVRPQRGATARQRPSWRRTDERAFATALVARSVVAEATKRRPPGARPRVENGGQGEFVGPATPGLAYGENAIFPNMLIGSFATRKPQSLAYFTGNSGANDFLQSVNDYAEAAKKLTKYPEITYSPKFLENYVIASKDSLERQFRITLSTSDYENVVDVVKSILSLSPLPPKFAQFAQQFLLVDSVGKTAAFDATPLLDMNGIAHSWGTRKNSYVQCKMVEGTGEILFNGQTLLEAFPGQPAFRQNVIQPLIATETLGKYNIWLEANVRRGGPSGRSEAARLAISHGLALHRPELLAILDQLGWILTDPRKKERKKAGQPKARKKRQWVKR